MDGNRRYAKHQRVRTIDGHTKGYDKLKEVRQRRNRSRQRRAGDLPVHAQFLARASADVSLVSLLLSPLFRRSSGVSSSAFAW